MYHINDLSTKNLSIERSSETTLTMQAGEHVRKQSLTLQSLAFVPQIIHQ
jgi:hypothetical protein